MMRRQPVESSNIQDAGYDADSGVLEVTFKNGRRYRYVGVSSTLYENFMNAPSKGSFFAREIRPNFQGERVDV